MGGHHVEKTRFSSIHEVPDEWVATSSNRDPYNKVYETRRYINKKKKQFLFQQQDGVPVYTRTPIGRVLYFGTVTATLSLVAYNLWFLQNVVTKKK